MTACFVSSRILGTCRHCGTAAREVHCPKRLKSLHCEACCPICQAVAVPQEFIVAVAAGTQIEPGETGGRNA
jgi:hypothetical protein